MYPFFVCLPQKPVHNRTPRTPSLQPLNVRLCKPTLAGVKFCGHHLEDCLAIGRIGFCLHKIETIDGIQLMPTEQRPAPNNDIEICPAYVLH